MSALFSSFIIEPVVRQARRFSSQGAAPPSRPQISRAPGPPTTPTLSHANVNHVAIPVAGRAHFSPALGIAENLVIVDDHALPQAAASRGGEEVFVPVATNLPRRQTTGSLDPVTQQQLSRATDEEFGRINAHAVLLDGAVDSVESSPAPTPDDLPMNNASELLQPPLPTISSQESTAQDTDVEMAPSQHLHPRSSRTNYARDIPRPEMSLREDSPSRAVRSLPADDGMRLLRLRIHQIRELQTSPEEKARLMHELMTEEWQRAQMAMRPQSPASMVSHDVGEKEKTTFMPSSPMSAITMPTSPGSVVSVAIPRPALDPSNPYNVQPEDMQVGYRPLPELSSDNAQSSEDLPHDESPPSTPEPVLGCKHYKRNVKIQCHDCREWHSCRHCHDANVTTHHLNRRATENMLCMLCWTPQPAGQYCQNKECGVQAAWYYCDICKLWDDDSSKSIYHCTDCGICRRGEGLGKDFVHCKKCNVCISIAHYSTHTCIENATDSNCPLCLDYMFTSPLEIVAMPCGHYLHHHCYTSLMLSTYQCPICKRSAVNMETQWRKLEEEIRHQPMPFEWRDVRVEVKCNDCAAITVAPFHWLGVKCGRCDGFNTSTVKMLAENEEVQRDVQDFAELRRERRAVMGRETFRRHNTAPLQVRPYFHDDESLSALQPGARPRSARPSIGEGFALPDWQQYANHLPNLAEYRDRFPSMPGMPNIPNMPGFAFPNFDLGVMERVGRGLGPIRHYFDDQIADGVPRQFRMFPDGSVRTSIEGEPGTRWQEDEGWLVESGGEEDDDGSESEEISDDDDDDDDDDEEEEEGEESDEDMLAAGLVGEDEEEEGEGGGKLDLELTGHR